MAALGIGIIIAYAAIAFAVLVIHALILRWIFKINKIAEVLTDISKSLRNISALDKASPQPVSEERKASDFETSWLSIAIGGGIEDLKGRHFKVTGFQDADLVVKDDSGATHRIEPIDSKAAEANRIYPVRKE